MFYSSSAYRLAVLAFHSRICNWDLLAAFPHSAVRLWRSLPHVQKIPPRKFPAMDYILQLRVSHLPLLLVNI